MFFKKETWRQKLSRVVAGLNSGAVPAGKTFAEIYEATGCPDPAGLALALDKETKAEKLTRVFCVNAPGTERVVAEYPDILDIPNTLQDPESEQSFDVDPRYIRAVFRAPKSP